MTIGESICKWRKTNNLSQEQLGEQVGVTRQTVSNWELDETSPNAEQLKALSKALQVSVDELLENDACGLLMEKVSTTEARTGTVVRTLKVIGIVLAVQLLIVLGGVIVFALGVRGLVTGGGAPFDGFQYSGTFEPAALSFVKEVLWTTLC